MKQVGKVIYGLGFIVLIISIFFSDLLPDFLRGQWFLYVIPLVGIFIYEGWKWKKRQRENEQNNL